MKNLFVKSIDLKKSNLYGGNSTHQQLSTNTTSGKCTDIQYTYKDDSGKTLETCTDFNCP